MEIFKNKRHHSRNWSIKKLESRGSGDKKSNSYGGSGDTGC